MSLGSGEIFIILILALLLFGPDKLPELARQAARVIRDVRRAADEVKSQFNLLGDEDEEPRRPLSNMRDKINDNRGVNGDVEARDGTSSTQSDDAAHALDADEIENDTYYINDADGNASAANASAANSSAANASAANASADTIAHNNGEIKTEGQSWTPLATSRLDAAQMSTQTFAPTSAQTSAEVAPSTANNLAANDHAVNDLELRVTPSTSVARASAPNRVRVEDDETTD